MKTTPNTPDGWMQYLESVKEIIQRELSTKEYSMLMQGYINRKSIAQIVEELK